MDERSITVLDPEPVRYGWKQPSLSRRGGVRLHWVRDGVMPLPEERGVKHRDQCGNKLRDVMHPKTGLCVGVISPLIGGRINQGTSGSSTVETRRADVEKKGNVYLDDQGRVIRTVAMEDCTLPTFTGKSGGDTTPSARKPNGSDRSSGQKKPSRDMTGIPGGTGPNGKTTRSDVIAYLRVLAKGRTVTLTPEVLKMARAALEAKRAEAARILNK